MTTFAGLALGAELVELNAVSDQFMREAIDGTKSGGSDSKRVQFDSALASMAKSLKPGEIQDAAGKEDDDIRAKLVCIAVDRRDHPDLYNELLNRYAGGEYSAARETIVPKGQAPIASHLAITPEVDDKHCHPAYRLAWEYLLINPSVQPRGEAFYKRVSTALARIHDERTLCVVVYRYRASATSLGIQSDLHALLLSFPDQQGLQSVLRCLNAWEFSQKEREAASKALAVPSLVPGSIEPWEAFDDMVQQLSALPHRKRLLWREVLVNASRISSNARDGRFVEGMLKAAK